MTRSSRPCPARLTVLAAACLALLATAPVQAQQTRGPQGTTEVGIMPVTRSEVPVTVVYGDRDSVVPTSLSARVADETGNLAERLVIEGADHHDRVMFGATVADAVARLARRVGADPEGG